MGSLVVGVVVLGLKGFAAWATGSIALFSDALESVVNVVTAVVTLIAVRLAARPANDTLPYGYHKAEYFSAVIVGVFIVVAALLIFREAYYGFMSPRAFVADPLGLAVSVIASVLNMAWAYLLISRGRRERSPALQADGKHLLTDVISTFGVLVGVGLVIVTGWQRLDAILAALVGLSILWSGWQLLRDSVIGLMDVAVDARQLMRIKEIISANAEGAIEAHDIRTRQAGSATFIEFHLVVPGSMTVEAAHVICDRIEAKLREAESDATVTIHVEPEDKAKHSGIVVI
ncbi:Cobalt-zinc-cadmium resistance protein [Devosia sp. DBB001]|nr:Cobalt-zinc-cadmium resistance protein [Devosia sp. DBB001]